MKRWFLLAAVAATLIVGCGKKDDTIAQAEKKDVAKGVAAPSIEQTKAIAEEGFIYGLPLVMNYAVMNEFAVDTKSSQFKAPFNEINNDAPRRDPRGHGGHHAEQRHAVLVLWLDLRAEPMVRVGAGRATRSATTRCR